MVFWRSQVVFLKKLLVKEDGDAKNSVAQPESLFRASFARKSIRYVAWCALDSALHSEVDSFWIHRAVSKLAA